MRIGLVSDLHGNAPATQACLAWLRKSAVDRIYCLGDTVGYLPEEQVVLRLLEANGVECQRGNHEEMLLNPETIDPTRDLVYGLRKALGRCSQTQLDVVAAWPGARELVVDGLRMLLIHGTPSDPIHGYCYPDTSLKSWADQTHDFVFMGNTHRPFIRKYGATTFVNVGSVGLPRDHGALSSLTVFDTQSHDVSMVRLPLDTQDLERRYGPSMHPDVRTVLNRRCVDPVGTVLE